jgi:hypothetical protein
MSAAHPMAFAFVTYFFALAYSHSFQRVAIIIGKISPVCKSGFFCHYITERRKPPFLIRTISPRRSAAGAPGENAVLLFGAVQSLGVITPASKYFFSNLKNVNLPE